MTFSFLEAARDELNETVACYDTQRDGLGQEFADEVENTIRRIVNHPNAWTRLTPTTRRCRTDRFPYGVVYTIRDQEVLIVAVMHLRRKPGYWQDRLNP